MFFKQSHKNLRNLFTSFAGMNTDMIQRILSRMPRLYLIRFLNYIHRLCIHDRTIGYSNERLEYFQRVLMCCPRALLTRFLISIDVMSLVNLLERCDVLWKMFFVGLINIGRGSDVADLLTFLMESINDEKFVVSLMLFLEREAKKQNRGLPRELRQKIFDFFAINWCILTYIVQVNYRDEMKQDINCIISLMNRWMQEFSQSHGLALNPKLKVEVQVFH